MATGEGAIYNGYKEAVLVGDAGASFKMMLVANYTPDIDTHSLYSHVSSYEVSGTGYTAGGQALAGISITVDTTNDRAVVDANDVTWTGLDVGTPSHAILYDAGSNLLVAYWELGVASNGNDYTLRFNQLGILLLQ